MFRRIVLAALAVGIAMLAGACSGGDSPPNPSPTTPAATVTASPTRTQAASPTVTATATATTPTATPTLASPTPTTAVPTSPTATAMPTTAVPQPTTPAATQPPPTSSPAATQTQQYPLSATIGATANNTWSPRTVTIAVGGTVTWAWSGALQPHNVVGDGFGDSTFKAANSYSFTFDAPGDYEFICQSHVVGRTPMTGTVQVR